MVRVDYVGDSWQVFVDNGLCEIKVDGVKHVFHISGALYTHNSSRYCTQPYIIHTLFQCLDQDLVYGLYEFYDVPLSTNSGQDFINSLLNFSGQQKLWYTPNPLTRSVTIDGTLIGNIQDAKLSDFVYIPNEDIMEYLLSNYTSFHIDPVYVDKTKVNFTDGTYIVKDGALDSTKARSEGYKQLLNTYGSFYRGTERELSNTFIKGLSQ